MNPSGSIEMPDPEDEQEYENVSSWLQFNNVRVVYVLFG